MSSISHSSALLRFKNVNDRLSKALAAAHRPPNAAHVLAVSKMQSAQNVRELYDLGQRAFGENYLQQALEKQKELSDLEIEWHFIGPIQSNKTRDIASCFDWVHSVDRGKIAQRLHDQRPEELAPLNVCLQVNVSHEDSKSGVDPADVLKLAKLIVTLPRLKLRGLMAIPAPAISTNEQRKPFAQLREIFEQLERELPDAPLDTLSMGMSADIEAAIAEGSTIVRVGTALFGPRPDKMSS